MLTLLTFLLLIPPSNIQESKEQFDSKFIHKCERGNCPGRGSNESSGGVVGTPFPQRNKPQPLASRGAAGVRFHLLLRENVGETLRCCQHTSAGGFYPIIL